MHEKVGPRGLTHALRNAAAAWDTYRATLRADTSPENVAAWDALAVAEVRSTTGSAVLLNYGRTLTALARAIHAVDAASPWVVEVSAMACWLLWAAGASAFEDMYWPLMHAQPLFAPRALVVALDNEPDPAAAPASPAVRAAARRVADALPGLRAWFPVPDWEATMHRAMATHLPTWHCLRPSNDRDVRAPAYSAAHLLGVVLATAVADADAADAAGRQAAFDRAADVARLADLDAATPEQCRSLLGLVARIRAGASAPAATCMLRFIHARRNEACRVIDTHMAAAMLAAGNPAYGDEMYAAGGPDGDMARYMHVRAKRAHYEKTGDAEKAAECAAQALALEALLGFT